MNLKRCNNGHFYDGEIYDVCPHCNECLGDYFFEKEIIDNNQWNYLQTIKNKLLKIQ